MGALRLSGKALAAKVGLSQNYVAKRLRDEAPFTLDDVERIIDVVDPHGDIDDFVVSAYRRHWEDALYDLEQFAPRKLRVVTEDEIDEAVASQKAAKDAPRWNEETEQ